MTLLRLALRNLFRSPSRSFISATVIIFGVASALLGHAFIDGIKESIIVGAVDQTHGHVLIRPAGYPTRPGQHPVNNLLELPQEALQILDSEALLWTPRLYVAPILSKGSDSLRVTAVGVSPERDEQVFPRKYWQIEGALPSHGAAEIAVSPRVARLLGIETGDMVTLQSLSHSGVPASLEARVSAQLQTGNPAIDQLGVLAPIQLLQQLIDSSSPSHIAVKLRHRNEATAFSARLQHSLGSTAKAVSWQDETQEVLDIQDVRTQAMDLLVFVLLALAGLGVANTILMASHERVREVGTLQALGMDRRDVVKLFTLEGALLGLAGGIPGALLGGGLSAWWSRNPLDLTELYAEQGMTFSTSTQLYTEFSLSSALFFVLLSTVVAILASIYPAWAASKMQPAQAVRAQS